MIFDRLTWSDEGKISGYRPGMFLDFNAIAQGYSVDVLVQFLQSKGIEDALVELGGEIRAIGRNSIDDKSWVIGIDDPTQTPEERKLIARIALDNLGMATSGNYRKIKIDPETGDRFVHILNPITGQSEKNSILSVTVLAPTAGEADGYATALMLMSIAQIQEWANRYHGVDLLVLYEENGQLKEWETDGFKRLRL
jgi:thiamine biosynthesis lipoprotein